MIKFLIQKVNKQIVHDFSFTLLESIRYQKWLNENCGITAKFINTDNTFIYNEAVLFKNLYRNRIPVGSVEFVIKYMEQFYNVTPKPLNVPEELFQSEFAQRKIFNGNYMDVEDLDGTWFIKSNNKIKTTIHTVYYPKTYQLPVDSYQYSQFINNIESEWRAFVYHGQLVGLQNYAGDFTKFPSIDTIKGMILAFKSAPIAYTLDVAVCDLATLVIECHDFFSCGLYGFADHKIYPQMLSQWYYEYMRKNGIIV
jgi:hypothetical protein